MVSIRSYTMRNLKRLKYAKNRSDEYAAMYEIFGLDVLNKSYEDFERRMLQIQIETIVEVKNRKHNLSTCSKWIFILEDIQQKSDYFYCIWGV